MAKTWCAECGERQFSDNNGGVTCANSHGFAEGDGGLTKTEAIAIGFDTSKRLRRVISVPRAEVHKRPTIARRSDEEKELSDATCTPSWLAELLYEARGKRPFDLDPCSNPRSHIRALWSYSLEKKLDGLRLPWRGEVFKNNPFSAPMDWQNKAHHELSIGRCTELVELCKMDPGTKWWKVITAPIARGAMHRGSPDLGLINCQWYKPDLWLFDARIQYDEHPLLIEKRRCEVLEGKRKGAKSGKSSNNFCSVLIHHRFDRAPMTALEKYATLWRMP